MQNKKMIVWLVGIPVFIILLIVFILLTEKEPVGISRALAYKSVALSMLSKEEFEELEDQPPSGFVQIDQGQWYVKYIDYLYNQDFIDPEKEIRNKEAAEDWLTYGEVAYLASKVSKDLKPAKLVTKKNRNKPFPKDDWWHFYQELIKYTDIENKIEQISLLVYGTPLNMPEAKQWRAFTSSGEIGFEGLGLDTYIDNELEVMIRDGELIKIEKMVSQKVIYKNIWITDAIDTSLTGYIGTISRQFTTKAALKDTNQLINQVVDIHLDEGKIVKVVRKNDRISGKVLSVTEQAIEVEGYGSIPLDDNFQVYKIYGEFKRQKLSDILVGYEMQEFIVADKKMCAALTIRDFQADRIRVLLMRTGFKSLFHEQVICTSTVPITIFYGNTGEKEELVGAGETIVLTQDDSRFKEGRIILRTNDKVQGIAIDSIERSQGIPIYPGDLELLKTESGIVIVNELYLEDYLKRVVPSEMPASYEKEALKAQAVCARTYAYRQIKGNTYSQYGAHVDDSTGFQVYNNINTDGKTNLAVEETYGELLTYQDEIAETYYFSTSSGHTTDGTIWGSSAESYPYLKGYCINESRQVKDLTSNVAFTEFIKNKSYPSYESGFPLYRWSTTITSSQLEQKVSDVGTITKVYMKERDTGGIGKLLVIEGSEATKMVNGQGQIRSILGSPDLKIKKNDGEIMTGYDTLPSAFVAIERNEPDADGVTTFQIYGGGYGHGVGMSQNGAQGMAKKGKNYKEILKFFYEGIQITNMS